MCVHTRTPSSPAGGGGRAAPVTAPVAGRQDGPPGGADGYAAPESFLTSGPAGHKPVKTC
ncbi:hypothetical protein GCM10010106_15730 [Thermopolyspora flexuosa]|nr:hypothetical protein GCM10010106_15730 [Thermopolyspora flexuosa]